MNHDLVQTVGPSERFIPLRDTIRIQSIGLETLALKEVNVVLGLWIRHVVICSFVCLALLPFPSPLGILFAPPVLHILQRGPLRAARPHPRNVSTLGLSDQEGRGFSRDSSKHQTGSLGVEYVVEQTVYLKTLWEERLLGKFPFPQEVRSVLVPSTEDDMIDMFKTCAVIEQDRPLTRKKSLYVSDQLDTRIAGGIITRRGYPDPFCGADKLFRNVPPRGRITYNKNILALR
jgi:hypothetical protein